MHPNFVTESFMGPTKANAVRPGNGLAVFRHPYLQNISSISKSIFHITILLYNSEITFLYLPPFLLPDKIQKILNSLAKSDIVCGDINVRYDTYAGRNTTSNQFYDRLVIFEQWQHDFGFQRLTPSSGYSTLDHIFIKTHKIESNSLSFIFANQLLFAADHPLLTFKFTIKNFTNLPSPILVDDSLTYRFNTSKLRYDNVCIKMIQWYKDTRTVLKSLLQSLKQSVIIANNVDNLNILVDQYGTAYTIHLQSLCSECLGQYYPKEAKRDKNFIGINQNNETHLSTDTNSNQIFLP